MQTQKKMMAVEEEDRLSDLPESILTHILSMLWDEKQVVRTSLLSTRWRFLWMSVPLSLCFTFPDTENQNVTLVYLASIHRELYYWKSCHKILRFRVSRLSEIRIGQRNVSSLVYAILRLNFDFEDEERNLEKECSYLKELLHSVAHVQNLELGSWCIECMSILELKGWRSPPSSWKFLELNVDEDQLDFPGICSFLQSSLDLETLVIDWYDHTPRDLLSRYTNEDEQIKRFETHNFNGSFPHLKTIKIDNLYGLLSENKFVLPLVKYLLKHAIVLEKFVIAATFLGSDAFPDYAKMTQEFLSFPRSSLQASVVFSY